MELTMESMYVIIDKNKQVIDAFVGNLKDIKSHLTENKWDAIEVTPENSPISQYDYYDGTKFVKEKPNDNS